MRQRITYLLHEGTGVDPNGIHVTDTDLDFDQVEAAAEERRITVGLKELPQEVSEPNNPHRQTVHRMLNIQLDPRLPQRLPRAPRPNRLSHKPPHNLPSRFETATWPPRFLYAEDPQCRHWTLRWAEKDSGRWRQMRQFVGVVQQAADPFRTFRRCVDVSVLQFAVGYRCRSSSPQVRDLSENGGGDFFAESVWDSC